jgi:hypothetical protein
MQSRLSILPKDILIEIIEKQNSEKYIEYLDKCDEKIEKIQKRKREIEFEASEIIKENIYEKFPQVIRNGVKWNLIKVTYNFRPKYYNYYLIWLNLKYHNDNYISDLSFDFQVDCNEKKKVQYMGEPFEETNFLIKHPEVADLYKYLCSSDFLKLTGISRFSK